MISYDEINGRVTTKELSSFETEQLKKIEEYTDGCIIEKFPNGYCLDVGSKIIDSILSVIPYRRQTILKNLWIEMYSKSGWKIDYDSENSAYTFSPKK